jgi:hypothetical protein
MKVSSFFALSSLAVADSSVFGLSLSKEEGAVSNMERKAQLV